MTVELLTRTVTLGPSERMPIVLLTDRVFLTMTPIGAAVGRDPEDILRHRDPVEGHLGGAARLGLDHDAPTGRAAPVGTQHGIRDHELGAGCGLCRSQWTTVSLPAISA
jgi:hypothetical protein